MMILVNVVFAWISIGLLINLIVNEKIPFSNNFTEEDKKDFWFDIIMGPISVIMFIRYLRNNQDNDKND